MAIDRFDNIYVVDSRDSRLFRVSQQGEVTMLIGGHGEGSASNQLDRPWGVAVDRQGNVFVADTRNHRIQRLAPDGSVSTVPAGPLFAPFGVAVDHLGNLYISERRDHKVVRVTTGGQVTVLAGGNGSGDGLDQLNQPMGLAVDGTGTLYIADSQNERIQAVDLSDGSVTTAWPKSNTYRPGPTQVAVDAAGNLYTNGRHSDTLSKISPDGAALTLSGTYSRFGGPAGPVIDSNGSVYFAEDFFTTEIRRLVDTTPPGPREITGPFARTAGLEGSIARLYLAILGRQPDLAGYDYWVDQARNGTTIQDIAHHFLTATEYTRTRSSLTNAAFINRLYLDVMARPADPAGATYWTTILDNGTDRATVLLQFSESPEFKRHTRTN